LGRAVVAFVLILIVLLLPEGLVPAVLRRARGQRGRAADVAVAPILAAAGARTEAPATLDCRDVWRAFGGIQALRGVSLSVAPGGAAPRAHPARAPIPRAGARARGPAARDPARRGAVGPQPRGDRERGPPDPPDPRAWGGHSLRRAPHARRPRAVGPRGGAE